MRHLLVLFVFGLVALGCGGHRPPSAPLFPLTPLWEAALDDHVVAPLGVDARRVFVATRDGALTAYDQQSGAMDWRLEDQPGWLTATPGRLLVRALDGTVTSLRPRNGGVRWSTATGVAGDLPVTLDADRLYVAGDGLAALDVESGQVIWRQPSTEALTTPVVATTARVLAGEADGSLRCFDRATGATLWALGTDSALAAPPLVDEARRRVYLGTTDRRILEVDLDEGKQGWRWKVGADIRSPGLLLQDHVFFAAFDAVLWGVTRGGNLAWRIPLPSRPLSGPIQVGGHILIACHEDEVLGFDLGTGGSAGNLRTSAEIRTAPVVSEGRVFLGLRNRRVVSYSLPVGTGATGAPPLTDDPS